MGIIVPDSIVKTGPWSYSMAECALLCPSLFHRRYRLKEKVQKLEDTATTVGQVVHKILEWVIMGAAVDKAFVQVTASQNLTYELEMQVRTFRNAIEDFIRGLETFDRKVGIKQKFAERKVGLDTQFKLAPFFNGCFFRGVVDLTIVTRDNWGVIFDHKSGTLKTIDHYADQVEGYGLFADAMVPGLRGVRAAIHFVGSDPNEKGTRSVWSPSYEIETVRTTFRQNLIYMLQRAVDRTLTDRKPNKTWKCNYCDYKPTCSQ
jgi:hypothetical protein